MNVLEKKFAAHALEFWSTFLVHGIENFREIGEVYPDLEHYVTQYIHSIYDGEPQLDGIEEVVEFLRHGADSDDKHAEHYLLGWTKKSGTKRSRNGKVIHLP